jgi:hypothetical protein
MLSIGSNDGWWFCVWFERRVDGGGACADCACGVGVGARLARGGRGLNVKVGEKGRRVDSWAFAGGGVKGGREVEGAFAFASSGLWSEEAEGAPVVEAGGCVADVGVGRGADGI